MKHASILLLAIGLCGLSFAACAEGDSTTFGNKPSGGAGGDGGGWGASSSGDVASSSSSSSSSSSGISSGDVCSFQCTDDVGCANNCPQPGVGIQCCAVSTGTCYVSASTTCPTQGGGSSGGMYP